MSYGVTTAYRLVIEGLGIEAVTDPEMERLSPDISRRRVNGLLREGLRIQEECDIARGEIEAGGMTVSIVDRQEDQIWCQWLAQQPTRWTWLTADLDDSYDTVTVSSTEGIDTNDVIHIGTEAMLVAGVSTSTELDVTGGRGWWQTIAQYHYTGDGEELVTPKVTVTRPTTLEGRRAYLYRYVDGDSLQGDGILVWRGVCSTDARLEDDGGTWTITIDSIVSLLKQPLASDLDEPTTIRGIYYPESQFFRFRFAETSTPSALDFTSSRTAVIRMHGFWPTQEAWCADLQLAIDQASATSGAGTTGVVAGTTGVVEVEIAFSVARETETIVCEVQESGHWGIRWIPDATNPRILALGAFGTGGAGGFVIEGSVFDPSGDTTADPTADHPWVLVAGDGGTTGKGLVPRGIVGGAGLGGGGPTYSALRLYPALDLTSVALVIAGTEDSAAQIEWTDGSTPSSGGYPLRDADASEGWAEIRIDSVRFMYPGQLPRISFRRQVGFGTIATFRDELTRLAPQLANAGGLPFLTAEDLASWTAVADRAAGGRLHLTSRIYLVGGEVDLDELVAHECRLYGVFPRLDSDGKIGLAYLELPTSTAILAGTLDDGDVLVSDQPPTWERNATDGSINVVEVKSGYSLVTEDHEGVPIIVRDVTALSTRKATRKLEIAPLSLDPAGFAWGVVAATDVARRVLAIFGRPYSIVKVAVSAEWLTTALCGSVLGLRSPRVPNVLTGDRGIGQGDEPPAVGLVIGRDWDLSTETGVLTLIVSEAQTAGYAPSVFVSSSTVVSGNQYDLTVSFDDPSGASMAPAGAVLSDFYAIGDKLSLAIWDTTTQSLQTCTVDAIDDGGSEIRVTFASAPTLTGTRYLRFFQYDDVGLTTSQRRFAFYADGDRLIDSASDLESAREYAA
ncbi:MAG: hypothetical protein MUE69_22955 [Myxococcota bacterium]|nr:hypothetical protein [Myxococcota bacterium]